ncbi:unnamed protein product [Ascophyllum nodosum]
MLARQRVGTVISASSRVFSSSRNVRGEVRSSGAIFDPYEYRGEGGDKALPPMVTSEGLKIRWGIMRGHLKSGVCAGIIQKHVPKFHASKFPPVANEVFEAFFEAHRKGDTRALAGLTTEELYATLKGELNQAKKGGGDRLAFRVLGFKTPTHVLQMREHRKKEISDKQGWGQVTCRLQSEREVVTVDANGREVRPADGEEVIKTDNVTIGTFEVFFGDDQKRWRLALLQELSEAPVISLKKAAETASTTSRAP